ncbi:hypothetical protein CSOJ01_12507 [Colletotrichum sojae]|uniref:Ribonuclease H n=1 Tax=Colletotrichum sojae TaxID=2175907 RepID=A0A8H6IUP0_9PEZI|nr:hypothetical protein CSOJ01_12507 [Colletotrichum sojae]
MVKHCYGVREGRQPRLYKYYENCKEQTNQYPGARFKGFNSLAEAIDWLRRGNPGQTDFPVLDELPRPAPPVGARRSRTSKFRVTRTSINEVPPTSSTAGGGTSSERPCPSSASSSAARDGSVGLLYAVARGRTPGVYRTWEECDEQVCGFSNGLYKKFDTLAAAKEFVAVQGGGGHFSQFKSGGFEPDSNASFGEEWNRLSQSQGWKPGSDEWRQERTVAIKNELQTHYFAPQSRELPAVKEEEERAASVEAVPEFDEEVVQLRGFQAMCREVGKRPGNTVRQCERILKNTLVNIIDLIDGRRKDIPPKVWHNLEDFRRYTLAPPGDKKIPWREANKDPLLRCFLQNFGARPGDRCLGEIDRCSPYSRARFTGEVDTYVPDNRDKFTGGGDTYIPDNRDRFPGGVDRYIPDSRARLGGGDGGQGLPNRGRFERGNGGVAVKIDPGSEGHNRMEVERDQRAEEDRDRVAVEGDQKPEEGQDLAAVEGAKVEKDDGSSDVIGAQGSEDKSPAVVQIPRAEENHVDATVKSPEVEEDGDDCVARRTRSKTSDIGVTGTVESEGVSAGVVVKQEGKRGRGRHKGSKNKPAEEDDCVVVKEEVKGGPGRPKRIRPAEEENGSPGCGHEAKKVLPTWDPKSPMMQRFISSA